MPARDGHESSILLQGNLLPREALDRPRSATISAVTEPDQTRALLDACQRGEAEAWERFVRKYSRLVYSVANRYRFCDADADDVHQAVFLAAVKHLEQLRQADRVVAWLVTTAHRESWRVSRSRGRVLDTDREFVSREHPDESSLNAFEEASGVRRGMAQLGDRCRQLLTLLFGTGESMDYHQVSKVLGIPSGSIGPTRQRCLAQLATILRRMGFGPKDASPSDE